MTQQFTDATIEGLAWLRTRLTGQALEAFTSLDNAGVFAALDEQTDYTSAEDILAEAAVLHGITREQIQDVNRGSDYGLTKEEGRRAGFGAALISLTGDLPVAGRRLTQEQAEAMFNRPVDPDELEDSSGDHGVTREQAEALFTRPVDPDELEDSSGDHGVTRDAILSRRVDEL